MSTYLTPDEPVEITWTPEGIEIVSACETEWWKERIAVRAKNYG